VSTKIKYLFAIIRLPGYGQVFFVYPLGVVNVLSNIEIFFSSQTVHPWKLPAPPI